MASILHYIKTLETFNNTIKQLLQLVTSERLSDTNNVLNFKVCTLVYRLNTGWTEWLSLFMQKSIFIITELKSYTSSDLVLESDYIPDLRLKSIVYGLSGLGLGLELWNVDWADSELDSVLDGLDYITQGNTFNWNAVCDKHYIVTQVQWLTHTISAKTLPHHITKLHHTTQHC